MMLVEGSPLRLPSRSRGYHRAVRLVSRWTAHYTRDLDAEVAGRRRDELASDLWEQGADADERGASPTSTALSILSRAARGVPADLSWRSSRLADESADPSEFRGWSGRGSQLVALVVAGVVLLVGAIAITRVLPDSIHASTTAIGIDSVSVGAHSLLLVCGMILLVRRRTRWLGAAWLTALVPLVLLFGIRALLDVSATAQWYYYSLLAFGPPWWTIVFTAAVIGVSAFYLALAIAWFPGRATTDPAAAEPEVAR